MFGVLEIQDETSLRVLFAKELVEMSHSSLIPKKFLTVMCRPCERVPMCVELSGEALP